MSNTDSTREKEVYIKTENYTCPNCNGTMKHDVDKGKFLCMSCGYEEEIENISDNIYEYNFNDYYERESKSIAFEGLACVECQNCGAKIAFENKEIAKTCPMCGSTQIATSIQQSGIPPEGIIPFMLDEKDAELKFKSWVKSRWFAPNKFKKKFQEGKLVGSYIPFWTYDSYVYTNYRGEGGNRRTVTETDKDGKKTTKTVVDWYPTSGNVSDTFDDMLICAIDDAGKEIIEKVEPFNTTTKDLKPYSSTYLSGYNAELYSIKADEGFEIAKDKMNDYMFDIARRDILTRYDEARVSSVNSTFYDVTYKHVLLPVWTSIFAYSKKTYRHVINGETGKVYGERPYSVIKIIMAIVAALIFILGLYMIATGKDFKDLFYSFYYNF